ncbi:Uncharacterized protein Rs2_04619 [Raphanus sativus]|nr:Uncharacterized protein Rs2_04619 [Raphanus sativus]
MANTSKSEEAYRQEGEKDSYGFKIYYSTKQHCRLSLSLAFRRRTNTLMFIHISHEFETCAGWRRVSLLHNSISNSIERVKPTLHRALTTYTAPSTDGKEEEMEISEWVDDKHQDNKITYTAG